MKLDGVRIDECEGKTIKAVIESFGRQEIVLSFTDGTFAILRAFSDDSGDAWMQTKSEVLVHRAYSIEKLERAFGSLVAETAKKEREEEAAKKAKVDEMRQRQVYEQLKAKFEKGP